MSHDSVMTEKMCDLLTKKNKSIVEGWIGGKRKFNLLYKATRDGCSAASFHNKCNNKGATVVVLQNTNNSVFGGYTSIGWKSCNSYVNDSNAFLFQLQFSGSPKCMKFSRNGNGYEVYDHASYGPSFGYNTMGVWDLCTFTNTINSSGSNFQLNGSMTFSGYAFNMQGQSANSISNNNNQIKEIEVYGVEEGAESEDVSDGTDTVLKTPWRKSSEWDEETLEKLKDEVDNYKPLEDVKTGQANILLIGQVGAGKSSFFNTINSISRGRITSQASSGSVDHSLTTKFRKYQCRKIRSGKMMNFRLCDTRGLEGEYGIDGQDVAYLLDGNIPNYYTFNPVVAMSLDSPDFVASPEVADKIHCVAFVIDASTVDVMSETILQKIKSLQLKIIQKGIPHVVLLTKIDKISQPLTEDLSRVFHMSAVRDHVEKVSQMMGLPRSHILPLKNYENEIELDENVSILALKSILQILSFADDYFYDHLEEQEMKCATNTEKK